MSHPERFPILGFPEGIPWGLMQRHENQALKNHGQLLPMLAERGGLRWEEALAILEDRMWDGREDTAARQRVTELANQYLDSLRVVQASPPVAADDAQAQAPTTDAAPPPGGVSAPAASPAQAAPAAPTPAST